MRITRTDPPAQHSSPTRLFEMRLSSTPRGARLARRLCAERLDAWGVSYDTEAHDTLTLLVAELAANAVAHGRLPGRDFLLGLFLREGTVRVEVTDTRGDRLPVPVPCTPCAEHTGGRGLLLVEALADRWGWCLRSNGAPGKTVWAERDGFGPEPAAGSRPPASRLARSAGRTAPGGTTLVADHDRPADPLIE